MISVIQQFLAKDNLRIRFFKDAGGSFVIQTAFAGFSFLNAVVFARIMGAINYGAFANAMAWVSILVILATFGFTTLIVRDISIYNSKREWPLLRGLLRFSDRFVLILALLIALVVFLIAGVIFNQPDQAIMRGTLRVAVFFVPLFSLLSLRQEALRGLEHIIPAQLPALFFRPGFLFIGVLLLYFLWPEDLTAPLAMGVNLLAAFLGLGISALWLRKYLPAIIREVQPQYQPKPWLKSAAPMMVYSGTQMALGQMDIVLLGILCTASDVGIYAAATKIAYILFYLMFAAEVVLAPIIARLYANGEKSRLQKMLTKVVRTAFIFAIFLGIFFIILGKYILGLFGEEFILAHPALIALVIGRLAHVALGPGPLLLSMTGYERTVANVMVLAVLGNIAINLILIPIYGIVGAAVTSALTIIIMRGGLSIFAVKKTGLRVTLFG